VGVLIVFLYSRETTSPSPTPSPAIFELESTFPNEGKNEIVIPNFAIHFTFTKPIDLTNTAIKISPIVDFEISIDKTGKTLYLNPVPSWEFDTEYQITVNTSSKDGQLLVSPIEYSFEPVHITTSELEEIPQ